MSLGTAAIAGFDRRTSFRLNSTDRPLEMERCSDALTKGRLRLRHPQQAGPDRHPHDGAYLEGGGKYGDFDKLRLAATGFEFLDPLGYLDGAAANGETSN